VHSSSGGLNGWCSLFRSIPHFTAGNPTLASFQFWKDYANLKIFNREWTVGCIRKRRGCYDWDLVKAEGAARLSAIGSGMQIKYLLRWFVARLARGRDGEIHAIDPHPRVHPERPANRVVWTSMLSPHIETAGRTNVLTHVGLFGRGREKFDEPVE